ncbi:MAG: bifunctional sulfate adenylyltransferase/adenylylsulfate kinase [Deltaproteobacteria bacterium]|jgi:sulfate adenylyltransferase|nr:bifunctional sulfate adenylyltransferase/adenylylsulfate kinase [Deltaproteobacteria bacterium]MBT6501907.1 bifunctional sulfate adenylyltransferase/adenylylsulfate kinase [Deltaproteobacteria bacterium]MBT7152844.1 bifunctional sulfate adenylyltransferase/adenylylsulfate kinase [Deltaproteobacteria bacterium]MBT7714509.1 bifunctional sulfate adenylyltransferase/adenylylsulfate kinase [Deltaproteobacteria bacterium]
MDANQLVNLLVHEEESRVLKTLSSSMPDVILNDRQICDFELLTTGVFSPLKGFMQQIDYESVLDGMRLESQEIWPVPVCLDIPESLAVTLETGQSVTLRDPEGFLLGVMNIEDIWKPNMEKEAQAVFGTLDKAHPGVDYLYHRSGRTYIGGEIKALNLPIHSDFKQIRNTPAEVRQTFSKLGWKRIVGFQTRQPIHRPQYEMTIQAMRRAKANLLLLPIAGVTKPGDFDHYTRMRCYQQVASHYLPDSYILNLLPLAMRMAGPREAILHLIIGRNFGCTHFVIGHEHASPGNCSKNKPFYAYDEAIKLASNAANELSVKLITFEEMVYLPFEDEYQAASEVSENTDAISLSANDIQQRIRTGKKVPEWATFPEVVTELQKSYPPPAKQGFTIFCTGLSGAGKSTIAKILHSRFLEIGTRPVSLLDGDIVRRNLSSELNFSREHRDINVKRIGFVAAEITKNRGIAICAPIAPYENTRARIRETIEAHGGFIEVHVSTPISECEKRDRKGMYAKARAGLLKGFTGVDDPYEAPANPELRIDTTSIIPDEAAREVMLYLSQKGFI